MFSRILKYAANIYNTFSITPITVNTKNADFTKDFFKKFEDIGK